MRYLGFLLGISAVLFVMAGCGISRGYQEKQFLAMDTLISVALSGTEEDVQQIQTIINELENKVSTTNQSSELYQINHRTTDTVMVSDTVAQLLQEELEISETTNGALNPALYPISLAWGFTTENKRVPSEQELAALLPKTDWRQIQLSGNQLTLMNGMELDFGATAKGFASDLCAAYLKEQDVESALLDFGGNVYTIGDNKEGKKWRIGIRDPWDETAQNFAGVLEDTNEAVVTSGNYERYFEQDGIRYHHIMDGTTGMPAQSGLVSVTVISESGVKADGLSTALFVMGLEQGIEYWRQHGGFEVIFITENGEQYYTEGLIGRYEPSSEKKAEVIDR